MIVGTPGSGKTMLALQCIVEGILRFGEPGMFVSFEESPEMLLAVAVGLGLPLEAPTAKQLHILDGRPIIDALDGGAFDMVAWQQSSATTPGAWVFAASPSTGSMRYSR